MLLYVEPNLPIALLLLLLTDIAMLVDDGLLKTSSGLATSVSSANV